MAFQAPPSQPQPQAQAFPAQFNQSHAQAQAHQSKDEDELLALLSADTFSLESNRDRALLSLAEILKVAIPGASSPPTQSNSAATSHNNYLGWPIQQQYSESPSTSASSGFSTAYSPPTLHPTPYGTPATATTQLPTLPAFAEFPRPTSRAPQRSSSTTPAAFHSFPPIASGHPGTAGLALELGCPRAPAVSREREGSSARARAGSVMGRGAWGPGAEEDDVMEDEDEGEGEADIGMDDEHQWRAQQAVYGTGSHPDFT